VTNNRPAMRLSVAVTGMLAALWMVQCGGSSPTVSTPAPSVSAVSLNPSTIGTGGSVQGTVNLAAAASTAAAVSLTSSNSSVATVPSSVTVPAGSSSTTFTVTAVAAGSTNITAALNGGSQSATLTVTPTLPVALFTVSGPSGSDNCHLINNGNAFDCTFNGSASTSPGTITFWDWTYTISGTKMESKSTPQLSPSPNCGLLPSPLPSPKPGFLQMIVKLKVRDSLGNTSAEAVNSNVKILPTGAACGF
jgi:hypothetical protein